MNFLKVPSMCFYNEAMGSSRHSVIYVLEMISKIDYGCLFVAKLNHSHSLGLSFTFLTFLFICTCFSFTFTIFFLHIHHFSIHVHDFICLCSHCFEFTCIYFIFISITFPFAFLNKLFIFTTFLSCSPLCVCIHKLSIIIVNLFFSVHIHLNKSSRILSKNRSSFFHKRSSFFQKRSSFSGCRSSFYNNFRSSSGPRYLSAHVRFSCETRNSGSNSATKKLLAPN